MSDAYISALAYHLPEQIEPNASIAAENPDWDVAKLGAKTGIESRHIAAPGETAGDLGFLAARRLLDSGVVDPSAVDALLLCTQSPDYFLPTTACLLQARLGLGTDCAALDFNQGCSGFIYGLWLAHALVASGGARNVLLITAETYSKYVHPRDRSVRLLFGDGAAATLITSEGGARIGPTVLGTDGTGAAHLIVPAGAARLPASSITREEVTDESGSTRTAEHLFMDGAELFNFVMQRIPPLVNATLQRAGLTADAVDWYVFHQANAFMNERLRSKLRLPPERVPVHVETCANTVSSTIPITLHAVAERIRPGDRVMAVGFGVGYSWGAVLLEWGDVAIV